MITSTDIKNIFSIHIQKGRWYSVSNIQDIVSNNYLLTEQDWEPHTNTRETKYPKWKHRIQAMLSDLKSKGSIEHDKINKAYRF